MNKILPGVFIAFFSFVMLVSVSSVYAAKKATTSELEERVDTLEERLNALELRVDAPCPPDSVRSGTTCIDKYEASLWLTTNAALIEEIRAGTVTLVDLNEAGAVQLGLDGGVLVQRILGLSFQGINP